MRRRWFDHVVPYVLLAAIGGPLAVIVHRMFRDDVGVETLTWRHPMTVALCASALLLAWVCFHLREHSSPRMAFSRVAELRVPRRGWFHSFLSLPAVLRIIALAFLAIALARPQTYRTTTREVESIDIMLVLDLSKSMEEADLRRNRLDAGQRTIRNFLKNRDDSDKREQDRIGLVVFAAQAMTQGPLTLDYTSLDRIVADLAIGDVPEMGTAIGDALALALRSLERSDSKSKVVILLSDGDSNTATQFAPPEAKELAVTMGVKVFTILLGKEDRDVFGSGRFAVNPELLKEIARDTGGLYFRAGDHRELDASFRKVRETLQKSRRVEHGKVLARELFGDFAWAALFLLLAELLLRFTRWRRFP
jgi:Ca-activated chloride channel family protein